VETQKELSVETTNQLDVGIIAAARELQVLATPLGKTGVHLVVVPEAKNDNEYSS
jgi:hypothetical protein